MISAHAIPGNESNVSRVIDSLHRAGAEVVHDRTSPVHVSGHASQEELKFVLSLLSPEWFVPVHGEYRHLVHHAQLAHEVGVPDDHVIVCEDGDVVTLTRRRRRRSNGGRCPPATCTSTASSATSATACSATGATLVGGGRRRRDRHRRRRRPARSSPGPRSSPGAGSTRPRPRTCSRTPSRSCATSIAKAASEGATDFDTLRRHCRKSLGRFIDERTRRRPRDPGRHGSLSAT